MARKAPTFIPPKFYAHYDKQTGEIFSTGNEINPVYPNRIEITQDEHDRFLYGYDKFSDYQIGYIRTSDNKTILALAPKAEQGYAFKNNVFEWISEPPTANTELVVSWSNQSWTFSISEACRERIKENITIETIPFFVMLANDFDFLIRTIFINVQDLVLHDKIEKLFESRLEQDITKISIASNIVFQSYGLKIND
jgi:hypothetical protein